MDKIWKNWQEFNEAIKGRKVVFFGVDDHWFGKVFAHSSPDIVYVVDNNRGGRGEKCFINEKVGSVDIKLPDVLRNKPEDVYVVITSVSYSQIIPQLKSLGLNPDRDFCCAPAIKELQLIADIDGCKTKLLLCSPDHKIYSGLDEHRDIGGGIYLYDIAKKACRRVFDGSIHHIIDIGDRYYALDNVEGGLALSKDFKLLKKFGFEERADPHGLAYDPSGKRLFIAKTGLDKVSVYKADSCRLEYEISLSDKYERYKQDQHHINDICVKDNYLYVSLFSHSGNWRRGIRDGGIVEIDLLKPGERRIVVENVGNPHSVCFIGGELCYLDSLAGKFYKSTERVAGTFTGSFTRGLAFDGKYYYVGASENRSPLRSQEFLNYISMNAGFYLFDDESKVGKFFEIPRARQIRSVAIYQDN